MIRFLSAGESHGKALVGIIEGIPANLALPLEFINSELKRRQGGYGRGGRMAIETDTAEFISGVRAGKTTGAPIAFLIENKDYKNWSDIIGYAASKTDEKTLTCVRPGHADLSGCIKYGQEDARNILERASARETAVRVAAGAICKIYLQELGIFIGSHVINIGGVKSNFIAKSAKELIEKSQSSDLLCMDKTAEAAMKKRIDFARENGDTAGGAVELLAGGMPVGIGSHIQFDKKLDYIIAGLIASAQAVKSVEFGRGSECGDILGSQMHDEIYLENQKICRKSNNAGGIEGGMSNGENIVVKACVKPIPTLMKGLQTIDIKTNEKAVAASERSDVCAVPAAAVVLENVLSYALSIALSDCVGGDTIDEVKQRVEALREKAYGGI